MTIPEFKVWRLEYSPRLIDGKERWATMVDIPQTPSHPWFRIWLWNNGDRAYESTDGYHGTFYVTMDDIKTVLKKYDLYSTFISMLISEPEDLEGS